MDILRKDGGFSLIETLVAMLLLGLLVTFTVTFFNDLFDKPSIFLKNQALCIAYDEMNYCLNQKISTDTTYVSNQKNLSVNRNITRELYGYDLNVNVYLTDNQKKNIVSLSAFMKR